MTQTILEESALSLIRILRENRHTAYWAGGAVRDRLLGLPVHDIDIATSATPSEALALFPSSVQVGQSFGVVRARLDDLTFEIATFRRDGVYMDGRHPEMVTFTQDPALDASRRDFTINALFYDPIEDRIHDYVHGIKDLNNRILRAVGDPLARFGEDRLRLLRAVRFATRLGFEIEPGTWEAICAEAANILEISGERIRDELIRMLTSPNAGNAFRMLNQSGLLKVILPEIAAMIGVEQPEEFHPEGDVFEHTMLLLDNMENPTPELAMAALFHDLGKPPTFQRADRIRFNGHDKAGAEMFLEIAGRLRLSNQETERVHSLVAQHMRIGHVKKMRPAKLKKLLRSDHFPELLELHRLDCMASHRDVGNHVFCVEKLKTFSVEDLKPRPLVRGKDLLELGFPPGPVFSKILSSLEDEQLEGRIKTREEALDFIRKKYAEP